MGPATATVITATRKRRISGTNRNGIGSLSRPGVGRRSRKASRAPPLFARKTLTTDYTDNTDKKKKKLLILFLLICVIRVIRGESFPKKQTSDWTPTAAAGMFKRSRLRSLFRKVMLRRWPAGAALSQED
jgi:hypothetical protein